MFFFGRAIPVEMLLEIQTLQIAEVPRKRKQLGSGGPDDLRNTPEVEDHASVAKSAPLLKVTNF